MFKNKNMVCQRKKDFQHKNLKFRYLKVKIDNKDKNKKLVSKC